MTGLTEVDRIEIHVLVDNELDPISPSPNSAVQYVGQLRGVQMETLDATESAARGGATHEMPMENICCAAHGLSLLITAYKGNTTHTLLFDTGPEPDVWERNARRTKADIGTIERIHLSHWHRDHSGGMLTAIRMINEAKATARAAGTPSSCEAAPLVVDLHPDRPDFRGVQFPGRPPVSMQADPTLSEITAAGAAVESSASAHTVGDGFFLVSGDIPRNTGYETGIPGGARFVAATNAWQPDPFIMDERLVACHLRGKGLVVFTGCSHAGVINACRHALDLAGRPPLFTVVGGFHLADNEPVRLERTLANLRALRPAVIMPGHCTGWRFKCNYEQAEPGSLVPCFVGVKYTLAADA